MQDALNQIKAGIANAIITNGEAGKNALIRTQEPINLIHNVVKTAFLNAGVHPSLINPELWRLQRVANPPARANNRKR
jgi:sulfopyruvate decarboxylase TPP-binding subunit